MSVGVPSGNLPALVHPDSTSREQPVPKRSGDEPEVHEARKRGQSDPVAALFSFKWGATAWALRISNLIFLETLGQTPF